MNCVGVGDSRGFTAMFFGVRCSSSRRCRLYMDNSDRFGVDWLMAVRAILATSAGGRGGGGISGIVDRVSTCTAGIRRPSSFTTADRTSTAVVDCDPAAGRGLMLKYAIIASIRHAGCTPTNCSRHCNVPESSDNWTVASLAASEDASDCLAQRIALAMAAYKLNNIQSIRCWSTAMERVEELVVFVACTSSMVPMSSERRADFLV